MNISKSLEKLEGLIAQRHPAIYEQADFVKSIRDECQKRLFSHGELVDHAEELQKQIEMLQAELAKLKHQK